MTYSASPSRSNSPLIERPGKSKITTRNSSREIVAVLLGNGFGRYNANDMKSMLAEVGVTVREDVSIEADILLLGTPFFDEETGEMVPWDARDEYKAAQSFSVQIIPLRDWTQWLGK